MENDLKVYVNENSVSKPFYVIYIFIFWSKRLVCAVTELSVHYGYIRLHTKNQISRLSGSALQV